MGQACQGGRERSFFRFREKGAYPPAGIGRPGAVYTRRVNVHFSRDDDAHSDRGDGLVVPRVDRRPRWLPGFALDGLRLHADVFGQPARVPPAGGIRLHIVVRSHSACSNSSLTAPRISISTRSFGRPAARFIRMRSSSDDTSTSISSRSMVVAVRASAS